MSEKTKACKKKYIFFKILSILLLFLPVGIFIVMAYFKGTTTQKVSLGVGVTVSVLFTAANFIFKIAPRSAVWILLLTLTISIQKIEDVIYVVSVCVILEECVTSKLEDYYKGKYKINKEIDDRIPSDGGKKDEGSGALDS